MNTTNSTLNRMVDQLEKSEGECKYSARTCISALFTSDFDLDFPEEQLQTILSVLTNDQINQINDKLDKGLSWF